MWEQGSRASDATGPLGLRWMLAAIGALRPIPVREVDRAITHLLPTFCESDFPPTARTWPDELRTNHPGPAGGRLWRELLQHVPVRHRAAVVLRDCLGLELSQVSELLDVPVEFARRLIHQGRLALITLATRHSGGRPERFWG